MYMDPTARGENISPFFFSPNHVTLGNHKHVLRKGLIAPIESYSGDGIGTLNLVWITAKLDTFRGKPIEIITKKNKESSLRFNQLDPKDPDMS